ncbi:MAG: hypothetical protein J6V68_05475 [Clostridia bacterium]|jgi:hypothetical protein|nr:hypothetical protein [Clostridia bacterium]
MREKFYLGVALGMIGGALITANSIKARKLVKNGQEQVMDKIDDLTSSSKPKSTAKSGK